MAPSRFMTARALMMRASVICARSYENVGFFLIFYDVSIARKSKVDSGCSRVSFSEFFLKLCTFWDTNATFHISVFEENLSEQFSLMAKNKKSRDIRETVWTTPYFSTCKMLVQIIFTRWESIKKFHRRKIEILKNKDKILKNICHSLEALLPWQRPTAKN